MKLSQLESENSTVIGSLTALRAIIGDMEKRFDTKIYIDSECEFGKSWTDTRVFLHGEKKYVDLVCLKLVAWQHRNLGPCDHYLYAYPVGERK